MVENQRLAHQTFSHVSMERADLHHAWIEECVFRDVCFDRADLSYVTVHGSLFERCSFKNTNFERAMLGYRGTRIVDCSFIHARFRCADFIRPEFDQCTFICNLHGIDFNASSFVDCRFEGKLEDVWFHGGFPQPSNLEEHFGTPRINKMKRVDFVAAELRRVHFSDSCDLSSVRLPEDACHFLFDRWPERLVRAQKQAESWNELARGAAKSYIESHFPSAERQPYYILNKRDIEDEYGCDIADAILAALCD